jgi:acetyl esterase/lipase
MHGQEPYAGVRISRDLPYGADERHRLDIFRPESPSTSRLPVLLFVHGGAYVGGDKHIEGSPFYSNIGVWAARHGMVGVNMTYRLAPRHTFPAAQLDIATAVQWVRQNIAGFGGDPERVFLMGHSAGASHAALYVAHPPFHARDGAGIAGAIFVSAFYDLPQVTGTGSFRQYHGTDATILVQRSPLPGLLRTKLPMLFAVAEYDTPDFNQQADILRTAFCAQGSCPQLLVLPKHSHMSEIYSFGTDDRMLTDAVRAFVQRVGSP